MAFWDWARWEQEIDWMALHGVNLPLAIVGEECVWRNMLLKLGYTEEEIGKFIAGPAFLAWWEMNNLEGWGGPLPRSWYKRQEQLQRQILKRMKELGMHPVLPGYCGMMPHDAKERLGLNVTDGGLWNGYQRPANLLPTDPRFNEIATLYYKELTRLFGTPTTTRWTPSTSRQRRREHRLCRSRTRHDERHETGQPQSRVGDSGMDRKSAPADG